MEAWDGDRLAGGLFGVALGGLFTSETMFHRAPDAGSAALVGAARLLPTPGFVLWDIQMASGHTRRFGAVGDPPRRGVPPAAPRRGARRGGAAGCWPRRGVRGRRPR